MTYEEKDEFILHSKDGKDYRIVIVNINECRPPDMVYAVDVWDKESGQYCGEDLLFVGKEILDKCDRINMTDKTRKTLEQIRAEIDRLHYHPKLDFIKNDEVVEMALDIIDKYR